MPRFWIGIAAANHVARGHSGGFMQLCHGKSAPLRRLSPGDRVAYYSPGMAFGVPNTTGNRCQSFTAIGTVRPGDAYVFDMGGGFLPHRRDVEWDSGTAPASILPLLETLSFTRGRRNWGYAFRFGLLECTQADMEIIGTAMRSGPALFQAEPSGASMRGTIAL